MKPNGNAVKTAAEGPEPFCSCDLLHSNPEKTDNKTAANDLARGGTRPSLRKNRDRGEIL
jgi:hypothetical protein